jgi:hypothetical protein
MSDIQHYIRFYDESGKQIMNQFKAGWGCPIGCKIIFGELGRYKAIHRVELPDGSLEITVRKVGK